MSNQIIAEASIDVNEAPRQAENAQQTANTANGGVNNINDPNKLAPAEKATLKRKYDTDVLLYGMDTKKLTDNQLSTSEVDSAMSALTAYMTPLFANMTSTETVDRDTLNTVYKNFDTADKNADSAFTNMVSSAASDAMVAGSQASVAGSEAIVAGNQASQAANNAAVQASVAVSNANVAQSSVATAITKAGFASNAASTASQAASSALASAVNAQNAARDAVATANSTASEFGKVDQKADSAFDNAMSAQSAASDAVEQASSAANDSKDAKQIAGAVSQSYKTLTDGSTMTIAELENGLAAKLTKTDLDGYATQVWAQNKIKVTADDISGNLSSVKKTVNGHTTSINDLKADSSGFKSQFTTVNDTLGKQSTDIGTLQSSSKELSSNFSSLNTDNNTNKNDISELKQTADGLKSDISKKIEEKDLNGYATQTWAQNQINTTADGINGTISSVKKTVNGHTTDINNLQADSRGFKAQFDTVNDTLGKQTTDIGSLQASSKELTSGFNTLTTDNTTNKNDISELKQTSTKLSSTMETVQTQVDNSAVGTNLIIQSDLKNGYLDPSAGGVISSSIDFHSDNYIATNGATVFTFSSPDYVFKGSVADRLAMYDSDKNYLGYQPITSATQTLSKSNVAYIRFCINSGDEGNTTGNSSDWLANHRYKLEKGSVATDWCPNPADNATVTALTKVKQTADSVQALATNNQGDITSLQATAKGLQASVSNAATKDQLDILSDTFSNKISSATSAANSKMIQTINNVGIGFKNPDGSKFQMNLSADGTALLDFSKIMLNGQTNIANGTIGNAQIANGAINQAKIANAAIGSAQIADLAVTNAKIGNVDAGKITTGILDASHLNADDVIANVINGKTVTALNLITPSLDLGDGGTLTGTYSVADSTSYFQPINGTGKLDISHGYIQSTANLIYYNKIMRGMANSWGYWKDSVTFVPEAHPTIGNIAESTLTPAYLKLDIFDQAKAHVVSRAYVDGTGLYINSGGTEAVSSMLSDFELLSSGRAYLMGGVNVPKSRIITVGNLQIGGYHTMASADGGDIYFQKTTTAGSAPVGLHAKSFTKASQLSIKSDISDLPAEEATRMLNSIDIEKYRYTSDGATYKYQYGAVIDDQNKLGSRQYALPAELLNEDNSGINMDSMTGILIKTVQDQQDKIGELSMRLTRLETK